MYALVKLFNNGAALHGIKHTGCPIHDASCRSFVLWVHSTGDCWYTDAKQTQLTGDGVGVNAAITCLW